MYRITVKYLDQSFKSQPLYPDCMPVCLKDICQLPYTVLSEVCISVNDYRELVISVTDRTSLVIERYSRKRHCSPYHPLVLFENDILWIGEEYRIEIVEIQHRVLSVKKKPFTKNALLAGAAALIMASSAACNPLTQSESPENSVNSDNAGDSAKPEETAKPENADISDDPLDHPKAEGDPTVMMDEPYPPPRLGGDVLVIEESNGQAGDSLALDPLKQSEPSSPEASDDSVKKQAIENDKESKKSTRKSHRRPIVIDPPADPGTTKPNPPVIGTIDLPKPEKTGIELL